MAVKLPKGRAPAGVERVKSQAFDEPGELAGEIPVLRHGALDLPSKQFHSVSWRRRTIIANIATRLMTGVAARSTARQNPNAAPGMKLRIDNPPERRYRSGISGRTLSTRHSGNSASNLSRSRSNTIQGSAPLAPDRGPSPWNSQSRVS